MLEDLRCNRCHQLLLRTSLELLAKRQGPLRDTERPVVEIKCERCGKINSFFYDPDAYIKKQHYPYASLLGGEPDD
ncbi:MAG: hypothetical protein M3R02_01565 [Chloroflexota bacterium]|nr:hypothetical protein [Chloroflexota bacterium]